MLLAAAVAGASAWAVSMATRDPQPPPPLAMPRPPTPAGTHPAGPLLRWVRDPAFRATLPACWTNTSVRRCLAAGPDRILVDAWEERALWAFDDAGDLAARIPYDAEMVEACARNSASSWYCLIVGMDTAPDGSAVALVWPESASARLIRVDRQGKWQVLTDLPALAPVSGMMRVVADSAGNVYLVERTDDLPGQMRDDPDDPEEQPFGVTLTRRMPDGHLSQVFPFNWGNTFGVMPDGELLVVRRRRGDAARYDASGGRLTRCRLRIPRECSLLDDVLGGVGQGDAVVRYYCTGETPKWQVGVCDGESGRLRSELLPIDGEIDEEAPIYWGRDGMLYVVSVGDDGPVLARYRLVE